MFGKMMIGLNNRKSSTTSSVSKAENVKLAASDALIMITLFNLEPPGPH